MKKLFTLLLLLSSGQLFAQIQPASVKGQLVDSATFKYMGYSGVSLIKLNDSTLAHHVWSKDNGSFEIKSIQPDTYRLQVTHPGFADYEENIILQAGENKTLPDITMLSKAQLLREIIIQDKRDAIRIKGDTTEYFVDSFLVNKNSNVEDLLKKLPGIQVDKNGKITAHGQEVKKVLVDGEEFFGSDPTVATQNLRADNVETVQVFDKKSDQSLETGIDDGDKEKTINLTLKDEAKKGYFGKVKASQGTENRYEHDAMFNSFSKKRKLSFYSAMSNTNKTSLDWEESDMYAGGKGETEFGDDGMMYSYYSYDEDDFSGMGIPRTWYTGAFYTNKFKEDKHALTFNANYKELFVSGFDNNRTQYILPDTFYFDNQSKNFNSTRKLTSGKASYEWKLDSLSTIRIKINGSTGTSENTENFYSENLNEENALINNNRRKETYANNKESVSSSVAYNKKFKLKGRSVSVIFNQNYSLRTGNGFLSSTTNFYGADTSLFQTALIDQRKKDYNKNLTWEGKLSYTEPLSKYWFIVGDYKYSSTNNNSVRESFDRNTLNNEYTELVDSLSSNFKYDITKNEGGLTFRYVNKKVIAAFGGRTAYTDLYQKNLTTAKEQSQHFLNFFPSASFTYKPKTTTTVNINYNGSTRQPTLQQIQPLQDNSNPLMIYKGNPNLKQSFRNNFSVWMSNYKPIKGRGYYFNVYSTFVNNDFSYSDFVDTSGRRNNQTINVNGNYTTGFYSNYHYEIKNTGIDLRTGLNGNLGRNTNYINNRQNVNNYRNISYSLNVSYSIEEKFDIYVNGNWNINNSKSTLREDVTTRFLIQTYETGFWLQLPKKFELDAECTFNIRQRTTEFDRNLNTTICNLSLSKKLLKKDQLEVKAEARDLFNQNIGFDRTANSNFINENTHTVLKRYILFSLIWNFTKNGPKPE